jgi:hypothetical protein
MLTATEVAAATLALLRSDLTGQVLDVKRHDPLGAVELDIEAPVATT